MGHYPSALVAVAVVIPLITAVLLVLAINRIQIAQLESDALTRGRAWSSALLGELESVDTVFEGGELSRKDQETIALASRTGGLEKFIFFNASGVAIAASDPDDIGTVTRSDYWADEVLRGDVHTTIERLAPSDGTAGSAAPLQVFAETYVPIFASSGSDRRVIGAFETYLNLTESARSYGRVGLYASGAGIALIAAAAAIALAFAHRIQVHRREREAMLAAERQTAESANRAKSAFLATVSHEIRTPMTGILTTIELLETSDLSDVQKTMAGIVRRSATSLLRLLNQLLDQSKIEAGKLDIQPRPYSFSAPVSAVVDLFYSAAAAKELTLAADVDEAIPSEVVGDSGRIEQILVNLVGNALKFTETGGVTIKAVVAPEGGDLVRIEVSDTGIGISEDAIGRLFNPFEQADPSTTRRFGGTGLGLAVSSQLADLMGGRLTVRSRLGEGSTFSLDLPLPAATAQEILAAPSQVMPSPGLRILVAEDDPTLRWVIGQQLERLGCSAQLAEDGVAASEMWRADPDGWDLIVTDWHMPELDGLGLLKVLKGADRAHPPVVMLTASGLPEEIETARRAGASRVLVKPVRLDELAATLVEMEHGDRVSTGPSQAVPGAAREPGAPAAGTGREMAVLDTSDLEALTGGDRAVVDQLLFDFADRLEADRRRLADADQSERRAILHPLRGAAAAIGAMKLADICDRLERDEDLAKKEEFERATDALLADLRTRRSARSEEESKNG